MRTRTIRLTSLGAAAAVTSSGCLVGGYLLGYWGIVLLGTGGLIMLTATALVATRQPPVTVSREIFPLRVTRGEPAVGMLTATNRSRWVGIRLAVRETFESRDLPVPVTYVGRGAVREVGYQLPTTRRGLYDVGPLRWASADIFGFLLRERSLAGVQSLYVYPLVRHLEVGSVRRAQRWDDATCDGAPKGSITFQTLREYAPGDDLRHIHWRSSARLDTLTVRHNIDVSLPLTTVVLVTDRSAYPDPGVFEYAVEVAAAATVSAARQRRPACLHTTHGTACSGPGGHDDVRMFLDVLAAAQLADGGELTGAADRLGRTRTGGALIMAAGSLDAIGMAAARRLAARYDDAVLALLGDHRHEEPDPGDGSSVNGKGADRGCCSAGNLALRVVEAADAAEFCARWNDLVHR